MSRINADKIRDMTNSELAEIIMCPYNVYEELCTKKTDCLSCCLEWLEMEAEE